MNFNASYQRLKDYINSRDNFIVLTHEGPDGDTVGSALGLSLFLKRLGKTVYPCSAGPFSKNEIKRYEPLFSAHLPLSFPAGSTTGALIVDCSAISRTGFTALPCSDFMVIDHHSVTEEDSGEGLIDTSSPSTTLLVLQLIQSFNLEPTQEEAYHLLRGFCTDTGFFRHLSAQSAAYFPLVSSLLKAGASPNAIFDDLQGVYTLASRRYTGKLLHDCESFFNGKLLLITESDEDRDEYAAEIDRDADSIYRMLLSVENVEVVAMLKQGERGVSGGLRAKNDVNVATVAAIFGGGGHAKASGFLSHDSLEKTKQLLLNELHSILY